MIVSAHQPNYLPYPGLIGKILFSDKFVFITKVQLNKKSWQNRNRLRNKEGELLLTVPILTKGKYHQDICDTEINNTSLWQRKHWRVFELYYSKATFYRDFVAFFEELYGREWNCLADLDIYIMEYLMNLFAIDTEILYDEAYDFSGSKTDLLLDICLKTGCDTYLSNKGSESYVDLSSFTEQGFHHLYIDYIGKTYSQMNYPDFIPYLSIFDMLLNIGKDDTYRILSDRENYKFSALDEKIK